MASIFSLPQCVNTLKPRQNGCHFADDTFKCIFLNENIRILIKIPLKFVPKGPINNNPALVQIMAWRRLGYKPLSEPMMVRVPTHICVTRPQWVKLKPKARPLMGILRHAAPSPCGNLQVTVCVQYWLALLRIVRNIYWPSMWRAEQLIGLLHSFPHENTTHRIQCYDCFNSFVPGRFKLDLKLVIFMLVIN